MQHSYRNKRDPDLQTHGTHAPALAHIFTHITQDCIFLYTHIIQKTMILHTHHTPKNALGILIVRRSYVGHHNWDVIPEQINPTVKSHPEVSISQISPYPWPLQVFSPSLLLIFLDFEWQNIDIDGPLAVGHSKLFILDAWMLWVCISLYPLQREASLIKVGSSKN